MSSLSCGIIGATGLVGEAILKAADKSPVFSKITTVTRRALKAETSDKVVSLIETDSDKWHEQIGTIDQGTNVFFSAFGTTRKAAGGMKNFKKIDYGINYEAAKTAKERGVETYVLISSVGANAKSYFGYPQSKGQLEDDIIALKFPRTIILRPGLLLGERETKKTPVDPLLEKIGGAVHNTRFAPLFVSPIYAYEIANVVVNLASKPLKSSSAKPEVNIIVGTDINKLANEL